MNSTVERSVERKRLSCIAARVDALRYYQKAAKLAPTGTSLGDSVAKDAQLNVDELAGIPSRGFGRCR